MSYNTHSSVFSVQSQCTLIGLKAKGLIQSDPIRSSCIIPYHASQLVAPGSHLSLDHSFLELTVNVGHFSRSLIQLGICVIYLSQTERDDLASEQILLRERLEKAQLNASKALEDKDNATKELERVLEKTDRFVILSSTYELHTTHLL